MNDAAVGFPWNKIQAARYYLLALKPWLAPIANRTVVVPVDHPPVNNKGWLVAPQTDRHGRIYLDRSFCLSQPLHVLAGAFEHEYAKVSRGVHHRLSGISPEDWDEIATPAFQLEIMDAMEREKAFLNPARIDKRLAASQQFSLYDYEEWGVSGPPSLTEAGALTPAMLGLPEGLSAETYSQLLLEARDAKPEPVFDEPLGDGGGDQGDAQTEPADDDGSGGGPQGGAASDEGEPGDGDDAADDEHPSESDDDGLLDDLEPHSANDEASGDPSANTEGEVGGEEDGDDDSDWSDQTEDVGDPETVDADGDGGDEWDGTDLLAELDKQALPSRDRNPNDDVTRPRPRARSSVQQMLDEMGGPQQLEAKRQEAMSDPDTYAWSKSLPHHDDEFAANVAPPREANATPVPASEMSEAINESATLTMRYAAHPGSGVDIRNLQVANDRLRSLGLSWEQHLTRVVSSCVVSERIRGASDLTYSVPNPNQAELGPRLMGMTDYAPRVTIVQDVSGSMTGAMSLAMDAMSELMVALVGRLQARAEWVTCANSIVNVGTTAMMTDDVREQWSWGGGGTQFGPVIASLMGGGEPVEWQGRRLDVPDLLVVSTDAMFRWPEKRPSRAHRLAVVVYSEKHLSYLPSWVDQRTEVVLATA